MTEVTLEGGQKVQTNLPAEKVADLNTAPAAEPAKPAADAAKPDAQPASPKTDEQPAPAEPKKPEAKPKDQKPQDQAPRDQEGRFKPKPRPIASLLQKKYEAETRAEAAERRAQELETKLNDLSNKPGAVTDADITKIMEKYGVDENNRAFITELVAGIRAGIKPDLPKEVQDLVAQQEAAHIEQQEEQGFRSDVASLSRTFDQEPLNDPKVIEKLHELAYSDEKAPDGQPYYEKPLHELYFKYVKPEIEPATPSAEPTRGGSRASGQVIDYKEIASDPVKLEEFARTATSEEFNKFHDWQLKTGGDVPLQRTAG